MLYLQKAGEGRFYVIRKIWLVTIQRVLNQSLPIVIVRALSALAGRTAVSILVSPPDHNLYN